MNMKGSIRRAVAGALCLLICAAGLGQTAQAADRVVEAPGHIPADKLEAGSASLTLVYPHSGVSVDVYKVATVDEYVRYTPEGGFAGRGLTLNSDRSVSMWRKMADTVENIVARSISEQYSDKAFYESVRKQKINPYNTNSGVTGEDHMLTFTGLDPGLYLVMGLSYDRQERDADGVTRTHSYSSQSYLVAVPGYLPGTNGQTGGWQDHVTANLERKMKDRVEGVQSLSAIKIWNDQGYEHLRPAYVEFQLVDISVTPAQVWPNSRKVLWTTGDRATQVWWDDLPSGHRFVVVEVNTPNGYTPSTSIVNGQYIITNTYTPAKPDPPPTTYPPTTQPPTTRPPTTYPPTTQPPTTRPPTTYPPTTQPPTTRPPATQPPATQPPVDIDDPDIPLGPPPNVDQDAPPEEIELDDPDIPLGDLPQTGQLWWPVPILALIGALLILVGLVRRRQGEYDDE